MFLLSLFHKNSFFRIGFWCFFWIHFNSFSPILSMNGKFLFMGGQVTSFSSSAWPEIWLFCQQFNQLQHFSAVVNEIISVVKSNEEKLKSWTVSYAFLLYPRYYYIDNIYKTIVTQIDLFKDLVCFKPIRRGEGGNSSS